MYENEHESEAEGSASMSLGSNAPGDAREELEGREQVGEGRVGQVVCILGFCQVPRSKVSRRTQARRGHSGGSAYVSEMHLELVPRDFAWNGRRVAHMIVYRSKNFLGGDDEMCHFPDGHFEVHLRELKQSRSYSVANPSW